MRSTVGDGWRHGGLAAAFGGIAIVVLLLLALMWTFSWGFFSQSTAEIRGETALRERTVGDGAYRIAAYDHFFELCASIESKESTIARLEAERETADPARATQIDTTLTALVSGRAASIHRYNADARKDSGLGQFRSQELPYRLDIEEETACGRD